MQLVIAGSVRSLLGYNKRVPIPDRHCYHSYIEQKLADPYLCHLLEISGVPGAALLIQVAYSLLRTMASLSARQIHRQVAAEQI